MYTIIRRTFSSVKEEILRLKDAGMFNVPENILALTDRKLLSIENHPLCIIKERIKESLGQKFKVHDQ